MEKIESIEKKWRKYWKKNQTYKVESRDDKPKYYCLDMFPYPSGAGLHVGHPRGYIASDILSRFKRMNGFNVLHTMGYDAFGLPAEQYAIETGQHPELTTENNIARFKEQLDKIGFCFDTEREFRTSDPGYYRWTQWIFLKLFNSWYDTNQDRARSIAELITILEQEGNEKVKASHSEETPIIVASDWLNYSDRQKSDFLMNYRLAYRVESSVNWCPALGTVLANDEIKDGLSERGGHKITKREMKQWMLRITAYADRLLNNLDDLTWPYSLKEMQRNWIGKSTGCDIEFSVANSDLHIRIFTTCPDTIYGSTFLVLAPEHPLALKITTRQQYHNVTNYIELTKSRSDRERMAEVGKVSGVFTGSYATHPLNGDNIPIWISDYVLPEYGTGAIMAVPAADERDFRFAQQFHLPLIYVFEGSQDIELPYRKNKGTLINSSDLNGLTESEAKDRICDILKSKEKGIRSIKYRIRDAVFGRQRYWGEPIPICYDENEIPIAVDENDLPIVLPTIEEYLPTSEGEPPLARAKNWQYRGKALETTTMPGWAGSSWYFLRYMDPNNTEALVSKKEAEYWNSVDCYIGGAEHATGHLLYSRFWNLFLFDLGLIPFQEPFRKVVCQGMILGQSAIVYRVRNTNTIVSADLKANYDTQPLHIDVTFVDDKNAVDFTQLRQWRTDYNDVEFLLNKDQQLVCDRLPEKMSKSKYNAVSPDDIIKKYGADCFRIHEAFLGPIDQFTPWSIQTIEGSYKFLKRVWRLFYSTENSNLVTDDIPSEKVLKITHQTIKKITEQTQEMSYNTAIATLMTCVNSFAKLGVHDKTSLTALLQLLHPYAPFITEELWSSALGNPASILDQGYPTWKEEYIKEEEFVYPVSINGKLRARIPMSFDAGKEEAEVTILAHDTIKKWTENKNVKKIIFIPNKIINLVVD